MKIVIVLIASVTGLLFGGCAEQPLLSDEEYYSIHGPAANSPDPVGHVQPPSQFSGAGTGH
jgi:hypothetical protein